MNSTIPDMQCGNCGKWGFYSQRFDDVGMNPPAGWVTHPIQHHLFRHAVEMICEKCAPDFAVDPTKLK